MMRRTAWDEEFATEAAFLAALRKERNRDTAILCSYVAALMLAIGSVFVVLRSCFAG